MINKILVMPQMIKNGNNDFEFDAEKYVNKIFEHETNYVYFMKNTYLKFPIEFVKCMKDLVLSDILKDFEKLNETVTALNDSVIDKVKISEMINEKYENTTEDEKLIGFISEYNNFKEQTIQSIKSLTETAIIKNYDNIIDAIAELKTDMLYKFDKIKKEQNKTAENKLKLSILTRLKEDGWSISEIKEANDSGLL